MYEVHAVPITVCGKSVAERMGSEPAVIAQQRALFQDAVLDPLLVHGAIKGALLGEQPEPGTPAHRERAPVRKDQGLKGSREGDKAVLAAFGVGDMHFSLIQVDIFALQVAEFIQAQAGSIKDG